MKQMPYKMEEGALERAKYRAKMAVREVAHPVEQQPRRVQWRWVQAVAIAAVVIVGVVGLVKLIDELKPLSPMEALIAEMKSAPDEVINEWAVDAGYYLEDQSAL